jgi:hypothetical protein
VLRVDGAHIGCREQSYGQNSILAFFAVLLR